jgi:hypothetical protein
MSASERLRQDDSWFKANLDYLVSLMHETLSGKKGRSIYTVVIFFSFGLIHYRKSNYRHLFP